MGKLVATTALKLNPVGGITVPNSGSWTLISFISTKNFAEGTAIMGGNNMMFTLNGWSASGYIGGTCSSVGTVSIPKTSVKVLLEHGEFVMRLNDQGSVTMIGTTLLGVRVPYSQVFEISDVGQTKVFAE